MTENNNVVGINISVPEKIHTDAKVKAAKLKIDLKEYVIQAIVEKNKS